jgi:integrase
MKATIAKLTKRTVDALEPRTDRYDVHDSEISNFMVRVTPSGTKSFAILYRAGKGRNAPRRRLTLGVYGPLTVDQARDAARRELGRVANGEDPAAQAAAEKDTLTVAGLGSQFLDDVDMRRKRTTAREYRRIWNKHVVPSIGNRRADAVTVDDVARVQRALRKTPILANRVVAVLGSFFSFADPNDERLNPAHKVQSFPERARERFLTPAEVQRLGDALVTAEKVGLPAAPAIAKHQKRATGPSVKHRPKRADAKTRLDAINPASPFAIAAVRFLLLSGWREGEALTLKWSDLDAERESATLADTKTGKSIRHLGAPVWLLLNELPRVDGNPYVFPGRSKGEALRDLSRTWYAVRHAAELNDVRLHDLRHSFASTIASSGGSLLLIGKLLGHRNQTTTAKYAHLFADPIRATATASATAIAGWLNGSTSKSAKSSVPKRARTSARK